METFRLHQIECRQDEEKKVHWPGIGPGSPAWQASILPLNHQCLLLAWIDLPFDAKSRET